MMSPGGSIVASLENVNGFLAVYTPSNDLIRTDFEQKGVVPEVMLHILKEFVFLLGRHSLDNEIPCKIVCKVKKPWGRAHFDAGFLIREDDQRPANRYLRVEWSVYTMLLFMMRIVYRPKMLFLTLPQECTKSKVACIARKLKGKIPVGGNQDWSFSQFSFVCLKGFNTLFGEEEWGIFLKETGHRPGYLRKVFYETSIEADMTKKATDTLDIGGMR
uniref:Uncharacterized protein n=1 Tax=Tanacetum cinerariifolium TaxID=118510 RepID=A0A699ICL3_TANCI|nr:hypothetical protein [Tanacetum cinerariifolium]